MNLNECSVVDLIKYSEEHKVWIEIKTEPTHYGGTNTALIIEPWEPFEPKCPYGEPIVYVKERKNNENSMGKVNEISQILQRYKWR